MKPVHFPARFPEVFRREERSGFDCLIGNPPWEKVVADREVWWGMHLPGVRSLPVAKRRTAISELERSRPDLAAQFDADKEAAESLKRVLRAAFPNLGSGQTDLYKAFSWANLELARQGGRIGIVLPRTAVSDAGMAKWRLQVTDVVSLSLSLSGETRQSSRMSVLTLINHKGWVFDGVHNSYTVALITVVRSSPSPPVSTRASGPSTESTAATPWPSSQSARSTLGLSPGGGFETPPDEPQVAIYPGPASSLDHYREVLDAGPEMVPVSEFQSWSKSAAFPQVPSRGAFRVWRKMKLHPRFDGSDLKPSPSRAEPSRAEPSRARPGQARPGQAKPSQAKPSQAKPVYRSWRFRPVQGDLNATNDRHRFHRDDGRGASGQSRSSTRRTTGAGS